ncbi:MAG: outer membrane protein assembly factor BamE domain-containing protein [Gemmataceae bacterium]
MAINTSCPHCSQSYSLAETQIGKKVRCKSCSEAFVVAGPAAPSRSRDDDERDEPRRPRPKKKGGMPTGLVVGLGIGAFVLLLGCLGGGGVLLWIYGPFGNKVTQENLDKIKIGMTEAEVKSILGEPNVSNDANPRGNRSAGANRFGVTALAWKRNNNTIAVMFLNGKVVGKAGQFQSSKSK